MLNTITVLILYCCIQEALCVQAAIFDVDRNPTTGALELQQILGTIPIATITRPAAPSAAQLKLSMEPILSC